MGQIIDRLLCSSIDLTIIFWAFLFFGSCAVLLAYLKGSEDIWQYCIRVIWYSALMVVGFTIILQSIIFIKTIMGSGCMI